MAAEPALEPTVPREEEQEDDDEGDESDVYEIEGEEGNSYEPGEDEDEDGEGEGSDGEGAEGGPESMTALLLGKQNGTTRTAEEEEEDEDDEDDEEYQDNGDGTAEDPIDLSSSVAGSKRGADELGEADTYDNGVGDEAEEKIAPKKARV